MFAHADDASVSDGPVQETAQIIVPLWKRLPSSRLLAVGLCLLDEVARPVLGAAEQLLLLRIFEPDNRYRSNLACYKLVCLLSTAYCARCSAIEYQKHLKAI